MRSWVTLAVATGLCLVMTACAGPVLRQAGEDAVVVKDLVELRREPSALAGATLVLGGEIIEPRNLAEGTTLLILQKPLDRRDRPKLVDATGGRVIVRYGKYLDPVLFSPGRRVTVVGTLAGTEIELVGAAPYEYVVVEGQRVYLWREPAHVLPPPWYIYEPWYPYWYDPYWGTRPWWW